MMMPQKIFHIKWQMKAKRHSKKKVLEEKKIVSLPQWDSNLQCLAWKSNDITITPREQLLKTGQVFLLFMFIALFFQEPASKIYLLKWKTDYIFELKSHLEWHISWTAMDLFSPATLMFWKVAKWKKYDSEKCFSTV